MSEPTSETGHRPHEPITEDTILRVDAALDKTQGHRGHAAEILGIEIKRFHNIVYLTPSLYAKWGKHEREVPAPTTASEIHREATLPPFSPEEVAVAEAMSRQEAIWAEGWEKMKFSEEKRSFLVNIQTTYGVHWKHMAQMFQGGVGYTATELLYQFNKIMALIQETYDNPAKFDRKMSNQWGDYVTKTAHEVRIELIDRALNIAEMFRKLNSDSEHAALISAQIEKLRVEGDKDVKKRKKARWAKPVTPVDGA